MMNITQIQNLRSAAGFTWKQILFLAVLGMMVGVGFALTIKLPVS